MKLNPKVKLVDGLEEPVYVRRWSLAQKKRILAAMPDDKVNDEAKIVIVINSACDADGKMLFGESDHAALQDYDWIALELIATAAMDLNTPEKKTVSTPNNSSSTASPAT